MNRSEIRLWEAVSLLCEGITVQGPEEPLEALALAFLPTAAADGLIAISGIGRSCMRGDIPRGTWEYLQVDWAASGRPSVEDARADAVPREITRNVGMWKDLRCRRDQVPPLRRDFLHWLREKGIFAIAASPDSSEADAKPDLSEEPFWNLQTVLCWIAAGRARDFSLLRLQLGESFHGPKGPAELPDRYNKAKRDLIGALGRGQLIATGCECILLDAIGQNVGVRERANIEPTFWISAEINAEGSRAKHEKQSLTHLWRFEDIRFDAEVVRAIWQAKGESPLASVQVDPSPIDQASVENAPNIGSDKPSENPKDSQAASPLLRVASEARFREFADTVRSEIRDGTRKRITESEWQAAFPGFSRGRIRELMRQHAGDLKIKPGRQPK